MNLAQRILSFNKQLDLSDTRLPHNIEALNPFRGDSADIVNSIAEAFYTKYYSDNKKRHLILGINPGRLGAGLTGIPFTDTNALENKCGISSQGIQTRETSAAFIYEMIDAYGGAKQFYQKFFIGAVSPLGFVIKNTKGRYVNYNYYDHANITNLLLPQIKIWFKQQFELGMNSDTVFCLGTGKNYKFIQQLNKELAIFNKVIALEHPRFIMQYRNKQKQDYIDKYLSLLP